MATYCTTDDVRSLISIEGALAYSDDDESGANSAAELAYITAAIEWGASQIDFYLVRRYDLDDVTSSNFLKFVNVVFAARNLAVRRFQGIHESIGTLYDEAVEMLRDIKANRSDIPDVIESYNHLPTVTNYWTQFWSSSTPIRVVDGESTGSADWDGQKKRTINPSGRGLDW